MMQLTKLSEYQSAKEFVFVFQGVLVKVNFQFGFK